MTAAGPAAYLIRVAGHLDDHWSSLLDGTTITRNPDGTTTLRCTVADQARLHGVLAGLRDIGVDLLDVRRIPPGHATVGPPVPAGGPGDGSPT
jgi:hypothetical protein